MHRVKDNVELTKFCEDPLHTWPSNDKGLVQCEAVRYEHDTHRLFHINAEGLVERPRDRGVHG
jgi:hypothetical protein